MGRTRPGLALAVFLALTASASAAPATMHVTVPRALDIDCADRSRTSAGTASHSFTARAGGYLTARLRAASGDWDLAVLRRHGVAAASAYGGAREVASGFVRRGERLTVRACRRTGSAATARVSVAVKRSDGLRRRITAVSVPTPTGAARERLERMGLDVAEHGGAQRVTVLLHGSRDRRRLSAAGFSYSAVPDRGARAAVRVRASALPSGRTLTYRRLPDYGLEMKALAAANPDLVKLITLPHLSRLGRPVEGLEITTNPNARDGKPVYLQLGMHHAREWPSAEHTLEWAYELIGAYRTNHPRAVSLMNQVRTIVVPIVNPDGFNFSRESGESLGHGGGDTGFNSSVGEYHRKNCPATGCAVAAGVDLNRNYGDLWGGPGTSTSPTAENYLGPAPFSEPETQNIRALISSRQVVVVITNHTFGEEILRQPGINTEPLTPDEEPYKNLGATMAVENGYDNIFSWQNGGFNNHVGTTDGWGFYVTGGLGYVIEIGPSAFHPPYAQMVAEFDGSDTPGGGNQEAYWDAMQGAANRSLHAVLSGGAPPGAVLRLAKSFRNRTFADSIPEHLESTMVVPASGRFEWDVNQSGRPLFPNETWTLTCEQPEGTVLRSQQVAVGRGQALDLGGDVCGAGGSPPPPPGDTRARVTIGLKLLARVRGRLYRARVSGALRGVGDFELCDGEVRISLVARQKSLARKRAGLDERCRFAQRITFRLRALPKPLRRLGARPRLRAIARWGGNEALRPATKTALTRVVRARR